MSVKQFKLDMGYVDERMLGGVVVNITVDTETLKITAEYATPEMRAWTASFGAEGTADYWLKMAESVMEDEWQDYIDD